MNGSRFVVWAPVVIGALVIGGLVIFYSRTASYQKVSTYQAPTKTEPTTVKDIPAPAKVSSSSTIIRKEVSSPDQEKKAIVDKPPTLTVVSRGVVTISPGQLVEIRAATTSRVVATVVIKAIQSGLIHLEATGFGDGARFSTSTAAIGDSKLLYVADIKCVGPSAISVKLQSVQGNIVTVSLAYLSRIGFDDCD
jgi:hypothetical protein